MKYLPNKILLSILATFFLSACSNLSNEVENKLNELKSKTESLDSLINKEVDKVLTLDSLINGENDKVKKLDSLINKSATKLDSIAKEKIKLFEKVIK
jgi:septal ring factor EnvC (AmiA/AmiB activator)